MRASGSLCSAISLSWVTLILCGFSLFGPFWIISDHGPIKSSKGLYLQCNHPYDTQMSCDWLNIDSENGWHQACAGMWTGGSVLLMFCAIGGMCLCCRCCKGKCCATMLAIGAFFAAGLFTATVILFGLKKGNIFNRGKDEYYEWGFYLSWLATLLSHITASTFCSSVYYLRDEEAFYY